MNTTNTGTFIVIFIIRTETLKNVNNLKIILSDRSLYLKKKSVIHNSKTTCELL